MIVCGAPATSRMAILWEGSGFVAKRVKVVLQIDPTLLVLLYYVCTGIRSLTSRNRVSPC